MFSTHEDAVIDFDLDFLHPPDTPFPAAKLKYTCRLKKRIIKANALYTNYHVEKQESNTKSKHLDETIKKLDATNVEYKQTSLEYQKALVSIHKLESEKKTLQTSLNNFSDGYMKIDTELRASQSHIKQLEGLVSKKDETIDTHVKKIKDLVDQLNQNRLTAKNKGKDKEILAWKKKCEALEKQMEELQNDRKRKLRKKLSTTDKNYHDFQDDEDPSFHDDDISECSPLSASPGFSQTNLNIRTQRESFLDHSRNIVSVDTGCGSSICSSDNENILNSPGFVFSPINVGRIENQCRQKYISIATSPIPQVKTIEVANSPVPSVRMIDTATSPIPALNIIKVMTNPVRSVKTVEIGTSPMPPNTVDIGTSPIESDELDENITSPIESVELDENITSPIESVELDENITSPIESVELDENITSPIESVELDENITSPIKSVELDENITSPITSLGLIEDMTNPTLPENKAPVTASQIPTTPIIIDLVSPITSQADDEKNDDDLMLLSPVTMEEKVDNPCYMDEVECTNSSDEMDIEDLELEQEESSIIYEISVEDIPFTSAQPTQIALEDLPSPNAQESQIVFVSAEEDISSQNAQKNQLTLKELQSTSAQFNEITSANVDNIPSLIAPATQTASECIPTKCELVIQTTTCDENKPDIDFEDAQLTSETVLNVPSINEQATQIALSDVQDIPSINVQTSQVAAENSVNVQVTHSSSKCIEDISSMDVEDNAQVSTASIASIPSISVHKSQEKECLEINSSNNMINDRSIDNEVEMILDEMRLNYKVITPLPKTPLKSRCQVDKTDNENELANMKNCLSNVCKYLIESHLMPVAKLRHNVNQLWFKMFITNEDSSNLIDDSLGDPVSSDNMDEPLSQSNLVVPDLDTSDNVDELLSQSNLVVPELDTSDNVDEPLSQSNLVVPEFDTSDNVDEPLLQSNLVVPELDTSDTRSPDPNMSEISKEVLGPEDIDQSKSKHDQNISLYKDIPEMDNEDCSDHNDSEQAKITSPAIERKAKNTRKLTNLVKYRKKCESTKYKIRSATPLLIKHRLKPKRVELIKHMQQNNASAILNNKEAYAKAALIMAELNAKKVLTNPVNIENNTSAKEPSNSDIKCTEQPTEKSPVNLKKSDNATNKSSTTKDSQSLDATLQESGVSLEVDKEPAIVTRSRKFEQLFSVPARRRSITSRKVVVGAPKDIVLSSTSPKLSVVPLNTAISLPTPAETATVSWTPAAAKRSRVTTSPKVYLPSPKPMVLSQLPRLPAVPLNTTVLSPTPAAPATVSSTPAVVTRSRSILSPKLMPISAITSPSLPESSATAPNLAVISLTSTKPRASSNSGIKAPQHSTSSELIGVVSPKPTQISHKLVVASPVPVITSPDPACTKRITRYSLINSVDKISSIKTININKDVHAEIQNTNSSNINEIQEKYPPPTRKRTHSNNHDEQLQFKRQLLNMDDTMESTERDDSFLHLQQSILYTMIDKCAGKTLKNGTKGAPEYILKTICDKIESCIATIADVPPNKSTSALKQLVEEMKKYDHKVFLLGFIKFLTMPERKAELFGKKSSSPLPEMTQTEQVLLYLIKQLRNYWSEDLLENVLLNIEHRMFKLNHTPDFAIIESVSHFFALLCRCFDKMSRLFMFMVNALYCTSFKAVALVRQCLDVAPSVIPLAHMKEANNPIITCFVYLLHYYKCEDKHNRVQDLRNILKRRYYYECTEWNESKILDMLQNGIKDLRNNPIEKKWLEMALIVLGKRNGTQWAHNKLVNKVLQPFIKDENLALHKKAFCLSMLGPLMRPYPNDMKVHCDSVIDQLTNILKTKPPKQIEEAAMTSIVYMSRHDFVRVNEMLLSRKMSGMSSELQDLIRDHIRTKTIPMWAKILANSCNR